MDRRELSAPFLPVTDGCLMSVQDLGPKQVPFLPFSGNRALPSISPYKHWNPDSAMGQEDFLTPLALLV